MPQGRPQSGELYLHFKKKLYQVLGTAEHADTGETFVIYQALYGDYRVYTRPYSEFVSEVDHRKYPDVNQIFRFALVSHDQAKRMGEDRERPKAALDRLPRKTFTPDPSMEKILGDDIRKENEVRARKEVEKARTEAGEAEKEKPVKVHKESGEEADPGLIRFLDARTYEEKAKIFEEVKGDLTDTILDSMAASIDVVIPDGPMDKRIDHLRYALKKQVEYESERLRK